MSSETSPTTEISSGASTSEICLTPEQKLAAIEAILIGQWDNPELMKIGALWSGECAMELNIREVIDAPTSNEKEENYIESYMDCSTCHISEATNTELTRRKAPWTKRIIVDSFEYGYWLHVPQDDDLLKDIMGIEDLPKCIMDILIKAYKFKCVWVKLDCDGPEHDDLEQYEW